jgi:transposase
VSTATSQSVGIDVSEQYLDIHLHPAGLDRRLPYNAEGTEALIELLKSHTVERLVLESTGGMQRRLERALRAAGHAVSVVNPERIWAYRKLVGRAAKTDRVDARLTAEYAATMRPAEGLNRSEAQHAMMELSSRRDQLIEAIAAEKKRLRRAEHDVVRGSLEAQIASLKREADRIEAAIAEAVSKDEATKATAAILQSIPGVGRLTAHLLAIELPELGRLGAKQIASLAGVAPHPAESGKTQGVAFIRGGRPRAVEAVHGGVQRPAVQPGNRRALLPPFRPGQVVQAGDDRLHEEAGDVDEHPGGARPGSGPLTRNLMSDSNRSR